MVRSESWSLNGTEVSIDLDDELRVIGLTSQARASLGETDDATLARTLTKLGGEWTLTPARRSDAVAGYRLTRRAHDDRALLAAATGANIARSVAHELSNLFACVLAYASAGRAGDLDDRHALTLIERAMERGLELFAVIREQPRRASQPTSSLGEVLETAAALLSRVAGPTIEVAVAVDPFDAAIAEYELQGLLINLGLNAIEAMPRGGRLEIRGRALGDRAEICVADTGEGMDERRLANLFQAGGSSKGANRGIGMAVVRTIVDRCGGTIHAASELGRGSRFTISLRRAA